MLKRILLLIVPVLVASQILFAQVTTSTLTGTVKSTTDEPLPGATITATHLPSGTKYATISRGGGQFTIANMRVGGPYTIIISFVGFEQLSYEDVFLKLAETMELNSSLKKLSTTLENVILTTTRRNTILQANRTGSITNIGRRAIATLPSISRSLNDFTRIAPQSNGASIAGGNSRQNNFTIDGADFNNSFGIGTNLPAGGTPISVDAIEEISVNITPFDVRQSGFIGSAINAVTRSGTNTLSGTAYNYFRNQNNRGNKVGKVTFAVPNERFKQYGFTIGGPLIKNKLFFFFNYETETVPNTVQTKVAATVAAPFGSSPQIARPTRDSLDYMSAYLKETYGYETGPYDNYNDVSFRRKVLERIDWNINSKHHLNVRYSQVEGGDPFGMSSSVGASTAAATPSRTANTALQFKNSNYFQGANFYSLAAELNSTFGKFNNTFRATYTYQNDSRQSTSSIFPFVDIMSSTGTVAPYTSFGYEPFTFGNLRQVKMYSYIDNLSWKTNRHNWTVGAQADFSKTVNGFARYATSYYRFATWDDFVTAKKPTDYAITYSLLPGFPPVFSAFRFRQYSAYGQDEIALTKTFRLTLGVRLDLPSYPDIPQIRTHPLVAALKFEDGLTLNTGKLPDKRVMVSPRLGFNWDLYGDRTLQIRGGTGVFTGKVPFVWIVGQSGDDGMIQVTQAFGGTANTPGPFNPDPNAYRPAVAPPAGTIIPSNITVIAPDFKFPQTWKSSLSVDTKLPLGMIATFEAIFNKDLNTAIFRNVNFVKPQPLNVAGYPDNRLMYGATNQTKFLNTLTAAGIASPGAPNAFNPIVLDNGTKGYYFSFTAKIDKPFSKGFFASLSYTRSLASNLYDGGGDQTITAWQGMAAVNGANSQELSYASFVVPDRLLGTISYHKEYFKHLGTTLSVIYDGSVDYRFSYIYNGDFNRDGVFQDLIYIPKDATNPNEINFGSANVVMNGISYTPAQQGQLFEAYIQQDKYLRKHRGQYAERNGAMAPWRSRWDVKLLQDVFVNVAKRRNTFQFSMDILNFANVLNSKWGIGKSTNAAAILIPQNQNSLTPGGTTVPTFRLAADRGNFATQTFRDNVAIGSTYFVQFGIKYIFN